MMKRLLLPLLALSLASISQALPVRIPATEKAPGLHFELPGNWSVQQQSPALTLLHQDGRALPVGVTVKSEPSVPGAEFYQKYCIAQTYSKLAPGQKVEKTKIGGFPGVLFRDRDGSVTLHVGCKGTIVTIGYLPANAASAVCSSFAWDPGHK